jgi:hypothetical protein
MSERKPSFLGSVLKAVVCTPNQGDDDAAYQREVVEPVKRWRRLWDEGTELSVEQKREVVAQLVRIFAVKRVDDAEQRDRLRDIAALHGVGLEQQT